MKKLLVACLVLALASCTKQTITDDATALNRRGGGTGVEDNNPAVPAAVLNAFAANFGNTPVQQWKLRNDGTWRAHFTRNGIAWEATFKADGTLVKSEPA